jgi:hypothetical protein
VPLKLVTLVYNELLRPCVLQLLLTVLAITYPAECMTHVLHYHAKLLTVSSRKDSDATESQARGREEAAMAPFWEAVVCRLHYFNHRELP